MYELTFPARFCTCTLSLADTVSAQGQYYWDVPNTHLYERTIGPSWSGTEMRNRSSWMSIVHSCTTPRVSDCYASLSHHLTQSSS